MFYYKLNLLYPNRKWIGSKACKKKYFISPQWLRNIKGKISFMENRYFFKKKKNIEI